MKASVTSMDGMQSAEEGAAKKADILTRSIEAGQQKIALIQGEYDRARERLAQLGDELEKARQEFGENSEEALKAEQAYNRQATATNNLSAKLNQAQADVNNMTHELDEMGKEADDAGDEMQDAGKKGKVFGDTMKGVVTGGLIVKGLEAMAQAMKRVGEALKDAVTDAAKYADDIVTLSAKTGVAVETLQEYQYMSELIDVSTDTLAGTLRKLTNNMDSARGGTGNAAAAFDRLGVSVTDANGELRDNEDVFADVIDALGQMTNETERDATAMDIFGRSAQDLNPLIKAGGDTIRELADEAHRMGYVLDEESLASLVSVSDAMERLKNLGQTVKNQLAVALAPVLEQLAEKITAIIEKIDWDRLAEVIGNIINFLLDNYKAVGVALAAIAAGFAAVSIAASPLTLIAVVIAAIAIETFKCKKALEELFGVDVPAWAAMVVSAVATGPIAILDKLNGVFGDNKKTAEDWKDGTTTALENVALASATTSQGLVQNGLDIQAAFRAMADALQGAVDGMKANLGELLDHVATVKNNIVTGLTEAVNWLSELPGKVLKIGGQLVEGLWRGISDKIAWLISRIKEFCGQALDAIKRFFGIASPSKVMRDVVGLNLMRGWAAGIAGGAGVVQNALDNAAAGLMAPMTPSVSAADVERVGAGVVNGMAAASAGGAGTMTITVPLYLDGREIAKAVFHPLLEVSRQEGVSFP